MAAAVQHQGLPASLASHCLERVKCGGMTMFPDVSQSVLAASRVVRVSAVWLVEVRVQRHCADKSSAPCLSPRRTQTGILPSVQPAQTQTRDQRCLRCAHRAQSARRAGARRAAHLRRPAAGSGEPPLPRAVPLAARALLPVRALPWAPASLRLPALHRHCDGPGRSKAEHVLASFAPSLRWP
jgi:hypothetical protein